MAQRLVRRTCRECRAEVPMSERDRKLLADSDQATGLSKLWVGAGCPACRQTGFRGRVGILELLTVNDTDRDQIQLRSNAWAIRDLALASGMRPLREDRQRADDAGRGAAGDGASGYVILLSWTGFPP